MGLQNLTQQLVGFTWENLLANQLANMNSIHPVEKITHMPQDIFPSLTWWNKSYNKYRPTEFDASEEFLCL